ncbi:MAG: sulfatase-like hydrolase/transferase [Candidatus Micrarchaeia archaeon]
MKGRPNIIFIMLDTLRADSIEACNGIKLKNIGSWAKRGVLYEQAIAPGTYTVPTHTSLFLNKRVRDIKEFLKDPMKFSEENTDPFLKKIKYIKKGELTLAKHLSIIGYKTFLFSNNPFLSKSTGLGEGFDYVENLWFRDKIDKNRLSVKATLKIIDNKYTKIGFVELASLISKLISKNKIDDVYLKLRTKLNQHFANEYGFYELDKGVNKTIESISKNIKNIEQNFAFINLMEAHEGYPTNLITKEYIEQDKWLYMSHILDPYDGTIEIIKKAYEARIKYLDDKLGVLVNMMKKKGLLDNAVLIFASDHGQGFMEHGIMYHNMFPYEEISRVPFFAVKFENGKIEKVGERVEEPVSLTDIHNSILDIAYGKNEFLNGSLRRSTVFSDHIGITEVWDKILLDKIRKKSKYAKIIYSTKLYHNMRATAIYHNGYKLIHFFGKKKDELYKIGDESNNIIDKKREIAQKLLMLNG